MREEEEEGDFNVEVGAVEAEKDTKGVWEGDTDRAVVEVASEIDMVIMGVGV